MRQSRFVKALLAAVVVVASLISFALPAQAHSELESTSPANEQHLDQSPSEISLTFSGAVTTTPSSLQLFRDSGARIPTGQVVRTNNDRTVSAKVTNLDDGNYVVNWRVVSGDTHPVGGAFLFSVGNAPTTEKAEKLETKVTTANNAPTSSKYALQVSRFAVFISTAIVIGYLGLYLLGFPLTDNPHRSKFLLATIALGIIASVVSLFAQAAASEARELFPLASIDSLKAVLETNFGRGVVYRLVGLIVALFVGRKRLINSVFALVSLTLLVASLSAAGHAVAGRWSTLAIILDSVHILAGSIWLTGLCILLTMRKQSGIQDSVSRFSPIALWCVVGVVVSGLFVTLRQVGSITALLHTSYGNWLLIKISIFLVLLLIAYFTRRKLHKGADSKIFSFIAFELLLIVAIFGATTVLTEQIPARQAVNLPIAKNIPAGTLMFNLVIDPAKAGPVELHVYVFSDKGQATDVQSVRVYLENKERNVGPLTVPMTSVSGSHYIAENTQIPFPGKWRVTIWGLVTSIDEQVGQVDVEIR